MARTSLPTGQVAVVVPPPKALGHPKACEGPPATSLNPNYASNLQLDKATSTQAPCLSVYNHLQSLAQRHTAAGGWHA